METYEVFHAIYGIVVDTPTPTKIGDFTFYQFPRDCVSALQQYFEHPSPDAVEVWFFDLQDESAVVSIKLQAVNAESAQRESIKRFNQLTNIFRFQLFGLNKIYGISVYEKPVVLSDSYTVISKEGDGLHQFSTSGVRRTIDFSKFLQVDPLGFSNLIEKTSISTLSVMEKRLLLAIDFFGLATKDTGMPSGLVQAITSMECLLAADNRNIAQNVSENYALLLGKSVQERKTLRNKVKTFYTIRSKIVHGDRSSITTDEYESALQYAYNIICAFIWNPDLSMQKTPNDFNNYIDDLKFAISGDNTNA